MEATPKFVSFSNIMCVLSFVFYVCDGEPFCFLFSACPREMGEKGKRGRTKKEVRARIGCSRCSSSGSRESEGEREGCPCFFPRLRFFCALLFALCLSLGRRQRATGHKKANEGTSKGDDRFRFHARVLASFRLLLLGRAMQGGRGRARRPCCLRWPLCLLSPPSLLGVCLVCGFSFCFVKHTYCSLLLTPALSLMVVRGFGWECFFFFFFFFFLNL